jgi:hypothetical protein
VHRDAPLTVAGSAGARYTGDRTPRALSVPVAPAFAGLRDSNSFRDLDVAHLMASKDFRDENGDRVPRPFTFASEIHFDRALAAADCGSNMSGGFAGKKKPGDIAKD